MTQRLRLPLALPGRPPVPAVINAASVRRSLVLFNGLFALQTLSDIAYLWAGAALPEGMSYASYAHRGAYPLLLTALLAEAFALIARPFVADDRRLRAALLFWVGQTCLLVLSSMLRLDLYIETYGLTRLRLVALIWMVTTAIGLALLIWQITRNHAAPWLLIRAAALGLCALYGASLFSFDRAIAQYNLTRPVPVDPFYICVLGSDALPAIVGWEQATGYRFCQRLRAVPARPQDWREWGFRNARTRSSLAVLGFGGV